jgi:glycylpeptide N-tetradecanoyltransferase
VIQKVLLKDVRKDEIELPPGFEWAILDLTNDAHCQEVYTLLVENYVEDKEH